jgi:hypothetical protein
MVFILLSIRDVCTELLKIDWVEFVIEISFISFKARILPRFFCVNYDLFMRSSHLFIWYTVLFS